MNRPQGLREDFEASEIAEAKSFMPDGLNLGWIPYASDRGSFPGCVLLEFKECLEERDINGDLLVKHMTMPEQITGWFREHVGATMVDIFPLNGSVFVIAAPWLNDEQKELLRDHGEAVRRVREEIQQARQKQKDEAAEKVRLENARLEKEFKEKQEQLRQLALQGERCMKNHKKAMPVDEAVAKAVLEERARIVEAVRAREKSYDAIGANVEDAEGSYTLMIERIINNESSNAP